MKYNEMRESGGAVFCKKRKKTGVFGDAIAKSPVLFDGYLII